jgi:hypothetical protein
VAQQQLIAMDDARLQTEHAYLAAPETINTDTPAGGITDQADLAAASSRLAALEPVVEARRSALLASLRSSPTAQLHGALDRMSETHLGDRIPASAVQVLQRWKSANTSGENEHPDSSAVADIMADPVARDLLLACFEMESPASPSFLVLLQQEQALRRSIALRQPIVDARRARMILRLMDDAHGLEIDRAEHTSEMEQDEALLARDAAASPGSLTPASSK